MKDAPDQYPTLPLDQGQSYASFSPRCQDALFSNATRRVDTLLYGPVQFHGSGTALFLDINNISVTMVVHRFMHDHVWVGGLDSGLATGRCEMWPVFGKSLGSGLALVARKSYVVRSYGRLVQGIAERTTACFTQDWVYGFGKYN